MRAALDRRGGLPVLVLGLLLAASIALLTKLVWGLTFYQDTWSFLIHRRAFTADSFLLPHNEHIVVIPVAIEKALIAIFGMGSATPEYVVLILLLCVTAVLLFAYVRRRLGDWPAVMAAGLVLFLGPAWTVLLWPFQIGFVGAMATGLAMLLALDREDSRGDRIACLLLTFCVAFLSLGLSFVCAAAVDVLVQRKRRGLRRLYVVLVPLFLFGLWYVGWGHDAESHLTLHNVLASPHYLMDGLAASCESLLGLTTLPVEGPGQPEWGRPLLVALIVLATIWKLRRPTFSPRLWPAAAALASFWLLAAFNYIPGREAVANRYAYAGAIFLLLFLADFFVGARLSRRAVWLVGAVVLAAICSNVVRLSEGSDFLKAQTVLTRADVGAIDIARRTVPDSFALTPDVAGTPSLIDINAAEYLPAMREYGTPGYSAEELLSAPAAGRKQADIVLAHALPIAVSAAAAEPGGGGPECTAIPGGESGGAEVPLRGEATRIEAAPGPEAEVTLGRFADGEFPVSTEGVPGGSAIELTIPPDLSSRPWVAHVEAQQDVRVCAES